MAAEKENKYLYNDIYERYKRMNRFYIFATSVVWVVFLLYLVMKKLNSNITPIIVYANLVLVFIFSTVNLVIYNRDKGNRWFKNLVVAEVGIEYFLLGAQTDANFLNSVLIVMLILVIPYLDKKN